MTPYAREEQKLKIAWTGQLYFLSVSEIPGSQHQAYYGGLSYFNDMPS